MFSTQEMSNNTDISPTCVKCYTNVGNNVMTLERISDSEDNYRHGTCRILQINGETKSCTVDNQLYTVNSLINCNYFFDPVIVKENTIEKIKNGVLHSYYKSGNLRKKKSFKNCKLDGQYIIYKDTSEKKPLLISHYKDDVLDGEHTKYDKNGDKIINCRYRNGKLQGSYFNVMKHPIKGKKITTRTNFINGEIHGKYSVNDENSLTSETYTFKNGTRDGSYVKYVGGVLVEKGKYKSGKLDGLIKKYDNNGNFLSSHTYIKGQLTGTSRYTHKYGETERIETVRYFYGKPEGKYHGFLIQPILDKLKNSHDTKYLSKFKVINCTFFNGYINNTLIGSCYDTNDLYEVPYNYGRKHGIVKIYKDKDTPYQNNTEYEYYINDEKVTYYKYIIHNIMNPF